MIIEKREHKRYIVSGRVEFATPRGMASGEVVSVSRGGMLMLTKATSPIGTDQEVVLSVQGHSAKVWARVVRAESGVLGMAFLEEPEGLQDLLLSLETAFVMNLIGA